MRKYFLFIVFSFFQLVVFSQNEVVKRTGNLDRVILLTPSYTATLPLGILAKRFGYCNRINLQIGYFIKNNWMVSVEGGYFFSGKVLENTIWPISTMTGYHITTDNSIEPIRLQGTGAELKLQVAKFIPFVKSKPSFGLFVQGGLGYFQHSIWINVKPSVFPQLDKTYRKGYDRLTAGPSVSLFLGIMRLERAKFFNFEIGPTVDLAFTKNQRAINFDTGLHDGTNRLDFMLGLKAAVLLPIFKLAKADYQQF